MALSSPSISTGATAPAGDPRRWRALILLALVQFVFSLDSTVVNVALPTIQRDLGFSTPVWRGSSTATCSWPADS